jgi:hypothetical protein
MMRLSLSSSPPGRAGIVVTYLLVIPRNAAGTNDVRLVRHPKLTDSDDFTARVEQLFPETNSSLRIKINLFADRVVKTALSDLRTKVAESIAKNG